MTELAQVPGPLENPSPSLAPRDTAKPLAPEGWGFPLLETSHCFTCLLPINLKMMGMESSVQVSRKQASHSVQLDPWHMLVGGECSLNANAEGTCPRLQYKLKSKAPFLPPCPPTPLPFPWYKPHENCTGAKLLFLKELHKY